MIFLDNGNKGYRFIYVLSAEFIIVGMVTVKLLYKPNGSVIFFLIYGVYVQSVSRKLNKYYNSCSFDIS